MGELPRTSWDEGVGGSSSFPQAPPTGRTQQLAAEGSPSFTPHPSEQRKGKQWTRWGSRPRPAQLNFRYLGTCQGDTFAERIKEARGGFRAPPAPRPPLDFLIASQAACSPTEDLRLSLSPILALHSQALNSKSIASCLKQQPSGACLPSPQSQDRTCPAPHVPTHISTTQGN